METESSNELDDISSDEIPFFFKALRSCEISKYSKNTLQILNHTLGNLTNRIKHTSFVDKSIREEQLKIDCSDFNTVVLFLCGKTVKEVDSILKPLTLFKYKSFTEDKFNKELLLLIDEQEKK